MFILMMRVNAAMLRITTVRPGKWVVLIGVLVLITASEVNLGSQPSTTNMITAELHDEHAQSTEETPLSIIVVSMRAKKIQQAPDGLAVSLVLTNPGSQIIQIRDPEDTTNLEILDDNGWPVKVPRHAPSILIHTVRKPGDSEMPRSIRVNPGEDRSFVFRVRTISAPSRDSAAIGSHDKTISIPPGTYRVKMRTLLLEASGMKTRSLVSDFIDITLMKR